MSHPSPQRNSIIEALQKSGKVLASQKALVRLLRSIKFLLVAILVMALLDILLHLSPFPRALQLGALIAAVLLLVVLAAVTMILRRPTLDETARHLEKRDSGLGSKLTNVLQLHADSEDPKTDPLTRSLARQAVSDSARQVKPASLPPLPLPGDETRDQDRGFLPRSFRPPRRPPRHFGPASAGPPLRSLR